MAGQQIADRVRAADHFTERRRADQQRGDGHQFDDHHQPQGPQHRLVHAFAAALHVLGKQHRRTIAIVGKQTDAHRADHQGPGRQVQHAVFDDLRLEQHAGRLHRVAETDHHDHQQRRHFKQQAGAGDPGIQLDIEDAQGVAAHHDHQRHGLRVKLRAQRVVQVSRGSRGEYRRDKQQHHQHGQERRITRHATKHALGVHILAPGAVVCTAQLGVAKGKHQGKQTGHHERQEHPATRLLDGKGRNHKHGTGRRHRRYGNGDYIEDTQGGFQHAIGRGGSAHIVILCRCSWCEAETKSLMSHGLCFPLNDGDDKRDVHISQFPYWRTPLDATRQKPNPWPMFCGWEPVT
ncbi:hypothetical protein PS708_05974 [Pseudomonas fluorescens]|nr:hypothetical protein PS708_02914 [Pseudomonas fluorescens]VVO42176.1 hypothetical protein PS708_05974 [Pseudomonas fluorescens]